jgi:hypothetical protein
MILKRNGIISKLATKDKSWWFKLIISMILSNIIFFLLFHENEVQGADLISDPHNVEMRVQAQLITSFKAGKKILIISREKRFSRPGILMAEHQEDEFKSYTILVHPDDVNDLLNLDQLQIIPFIKDIKFKPSSERLTYEVRY